MLHTVHTTSLLYWIMHVPWDAVLFLQEIEWHIMKCCHFVSRSNQRPVDRDGTPISSLHDYASAPVHTLLWWKNKNILHVFLLITPVANVAKMSCYSGGIWCLELMIVLLENLGAHTDHVAQGPIPPQRIVLQTTAHLCMYCESWRQRLFIVSFSVRAPNESRRKNAMLLVVLIRLTKNRN